MKLGQMTLNTEDGTTGTLTGYTFYRNGGYKSVFVLTEYGKEEWSIKTIISLN